MSAAPRTVLLAEDDPTVTRMLLDLLETRGFRVWCAESAGEAQAKLDEGRPDLIILDLVLPDASGLLLCADLKARTGAPMIVCSGTKRQEDVVLSLKLGADDFVAKPFSSAELLARIDAVLRRAAAPSPPPAGKPGALALSIGALTIDQTRCQVLLDGQPLHLTPSEYRLLQALASRPEEVLAPRELAEAVWGYFDPDIGRSLLVHMSRLRAKLEQTGAAAPRLVTLRGFGYTLVPREGRAVAVAGSRAAGTA